jgi:hypothetical protein
VACAQLGKAFTGIERERKYFDIACERISRAQAQGQLLPPEEPRQSVQEWLLLNLTQSSADTRIVCVDANVSGIAMTDQKFLWLIHERLVKVHGEREMADYMHHLRHIIADTKPTQTTPNVARCDTTPELLRNKFDTPNAELSGVHLIDGLDDKLRRDK